MEPVDIVISWDTWWRVVAAIVVGCGIYDILLWAWDTVVDALRDAGRWARRQWERLDEYRAEKPLWRRTWDHVLNTDVDRYAARFVAEPPERIPEAIWVVNKATNALHRAECPKADGISDPWHWASTLAEARYWAGEQDLKVGCSCRPLHENAEVAS